MALALVAALIAPGLIGEARAADWQMPGIYAYEVKDWDPDVGKHFPRLIVRYYTVGAIDPQVALIRKLAENGNPILIDFEFIRNYDQRRGAEDLPPYEEVEAELLSVLDKLEGTPIEAISFDEENGLSANKITYLNRLYRAAKQSFPKRQFLQWIAMQSKAGHVDLGWVGSIATDGWVIDPYLSSEEDYGEIVQRLTETSKPIYSVIWATPGRPIGKRPHPGTDAGWWNDSQWKTFYNRLAINQANKVATIFYLYGTEGKTIKRTWAGNPCDRQFYSDLVNVTLPYYRSHRLSPVTPASRPKWIPGYCEGTR
ncbi:hypothetical protein CVO77_05615 [Sphingopyxis lindanitolerans]|uniref:GH26 domain-containing protein n=1 Tax=Sphingopyxis lindanitolerans TaxID=2054227 RepID=A0A2S8B6I3_9SPHN|nr:hypothetical protein [Sphingopyxis lindanitolerans]PQM28005.1 hypothetical protein CVO77_05615 [Sphingopyxis lindanitolerans]